MRGSTVHGPLRWRGAVVLGIAVLGVAGVVSGCSDNDSKPDTVVDPGPVFEELGRCSDFNELKSPFFGDTHVHTTLSLDANTQGNRLTPSDAYRFARGEEIGIQPYDAEGNPLRRAQLTRPLDFTVLSDHAEFLGVVYSCVTEGTPGYDSAVCQDYRNRPDQAFIALNLAVSGQQGLAKTPAPCLDEEGGCPEQQLTAWQQVQDAAEAAYDRTPSCTFTSFVGYEWSASPGTRNLHRNVVFRNHKVPETPASYFDENYEEGLWASLKANCLDDEPCDVLAIPHNSNLSSGLMFETVDDNGDPFDEEYARLRRQMEPLVEVFQHKGDSECLPGSLASDEACDFEKLEYANLAKANLGGEADEIEPNNMIRPALGVGLQLEQSLGVNPFQLGMIASTDTHLGTPGFTEEPDFVGHGGAGLTVRDSLPPGLPDRVWFNPGGLAVVWAEENSREAIFLAMRNREAYGTSGTRIVLRFFGGFDYADSLCDSSELVQQGYDQGVPMGGVLQGPAGAAPRFVISALQDPGTVERPGTSLQRIQIVKGWLEGDEPQFATFDVAGNAGNGASVDPTTCETSGEGASSLCGVWTDPDFDSGQRAFYYARVLENPTCRWHMYFCNAGGVRCDDPSTITEGFEGCCDQPAVQQERAWSSPIWYSP